MKRTFIALMIALASLGSSAVERSLLAMPDSALEQRWNKAAEQYDKAYILSGCKNTRTPKPGLTIYLCQTQSAGGVVSFERVGGQLERILFWSSRHPVNDSSMFIRFVRSTATGDMGAVGMRLLKEAKASGRSCAREDGAKVCASHDAGEFMLEALKAP